jgi:hypothetical protein
MGMCGIGCKGRIDLDEDGCPIHGPLSDHMYRLLKVDFRRAGPSMDEYHERYMRELGLTPEIIEKRYERRKARKAAGGGWYTPPSECKSPISDEITAEVTSDSES